MYHNQRLTLFLLCLLMLCFTGCSKIEHEPIVLSSEGETSSEETTRLDSELESESAMEELQVDEDESESEEGLSTSIHVVAVGDNLVQQKVYETAATHAEDGQEYNFAYCYEYITPYIDGDLNIINQETLICGGDYEISGSNYNFNSPEELGDAVIAMGFNVITMCNNHLLDKGVSGLSSCLDYWDTKMAENPDVLVYGVYRDEDDLTDIRTMEINGKTIAFLGYTEHINGYTLPEDSELQIPLTSDETLMELQITKAKELYDIVIVTCHWGNEDTYTVTDSQKALAQKIINWGADVILGTHSHVAHTMEYLTREDGTQGFVFYSLGNFISGQTDNFNLIGELADFDLCVDKLGTVTIENVEVMPVITHYEAGLTNLRLYPISLYTESLANSHGLPYCTSSTSSYYQVWNLDRIAELFALAVPEEYQNLD